MSEQSAHSLAMSFFKKQGWQAFPFQEDTWKACAAGKSGILNAPTGSGKTYALMLPIVADASESRKAGVKAIWITPIRALGKEIEIAAQRVKKVMDLPFTVGVRSGDTSAAERARLAKSPPDLLITTPESLQILLASRGHEDYFRSLRWMVIDEWHELVGSKRGVQMELACSRLRAIVPELRTWGISATISNMDEALDILLGHNAGKGKRIKPVVIRAQIHKPIEVVSVLPDEPGSLPWAGHLGIRIIEKVIPILRESKSTLIFTNTRSFAEIWYQQLLEKAPWLAGQLAMHHGSISQELRQWVEQELHAGNLKAVVCTSSLDLGVDFRPVETVIQVGSPKGIARFLQRAGRSGHQPGAVSKIHFLPTHSLELVEAAALREGIRQKVVEERVAYIRSFDVLIQYLLTLAAGDGLDVSTVRREVESTWSFQSVTEDEWNWIIRFLTTGGEALTAYDEYRKLELRDGRLRFVSLALARKHRLSIGTIVGDTSIRVRYERGKYLGSIEEYFISGLSPGDVFWFAGRSLELVRIRGMEAHVRNSNKKTGKVPSWQGGRMPLSSPLGALIRKKIDEAATGQDQDPEMVFLRPLTGLQQERSWLPKEDEFLIEYLQTDEGHHLLMYPFEGRFVHEGLAALIAQRIATLTPITFTIAMNDYGFELLADREIPVEEALEHDLFRTGDLLRDIQSSVNSTEMARRKFRDIAAIAGLVFKGFPGAVVKDRHLQSSAQLLFDVFRQYESDNLLLLQSYEEVMDFQLEEARLRRALDRINRQKIVLRRPDRHTPFAFPVMVDRLREKLSSEQIMDRIKRLSVMYE